MRTMFVINHNPAVNPAGRTETREAVRAIILRGSRLLMIYSQRNGDYKFPGGGIQNGETHAAALIREIQEECGASGINILQPYGKAIEYNRSIDAEYEVFRMTSYYYLCQCDEVLGQQQLDRYEQELGFVPVWVEIEQAIRTNAALVLNEHNPPARWTRRDLAVLEQVKLELDQG